MPTQDIIETPKNGLPSWWSHATATICSRAAAGNPPVAEYPYTDHDFFPDGRAAAEQFRHRRPPGAVIRAHPITRGGQHETLERISAEEGETRSRRRSRSGPGSRARAAQHCQHRCQIAGCLHWILLLPKTRQRAPSWWSTRDGATICSTRPRGQSSRWPGNFPTNGSRFLLPDPPRRNRNSFIAEASGAVIRVIHHQMGQEETLERIGKRRGRNAKVAGAHANAFGRPSRGAAQHGQHRSSLDRPVRRAATAMPNGR